VKRSGLFLFLSLLVVLAGCGGYNAPSATANTSHIAERVFLSNEATNVLDLIDASKDEFSTFTDNNTGQISNFTIALTAGPTSMLETTDKKTILVYLSVTKALSIVDTTTESQVGTLVFPDSVTSLAMAANGTKAYAAIPTAVCSGSAITGAVEVVSLSTAKITACVPVAAARSLVLSHDGKTLLVFAQDTNTAIFVDSTSLAVTAIDPTGTVLDRPVSAVFAADDSTAYIMSCGAECGGVQAAVVPWARSNNALGTPAPVPAAHEALLDSGNLFVAGSDPILGGRLTVLSTSGLSTTKGPFAISDGVHDTALLYKGQLFIGARACADTVHGCLSIYDTASGKIAFSAVSPNSNTAPGGDDVTGMEAIPGRSVVYVCEGGALRIYDTTTDALQPKQITIPGNIVDAREVF